MNSHQLIQKNQPEEMGPQPNQFTQEDVTEIVAEGADPKSSEQQSRQ